MTRPYQIRPEKVSDFRRWLKERGGVLIWENLEIGCDRPSIMTPATTEGHTTRPPHWAYGNPKPIQPEEIEVCQESIVPLPPEWFPVCDYCLGKGAFTVESYAKNGVFTYETAEENLRAIGTVIKDGKYDCWRCQGTGHIDRRIRVAIRKKHWGLDISDGGKKKAEKIAGKLRDFTLETVHWRWEGVGWGLADLVFYTQKVTPFTLESENDKPI